MQLVERHYIKPSHSDYSIIDDLAFKSKNLYNYVTYLIRQEFIFNGKMLSEYDLSKQLCKNNQFDFRNLPSVTSNQIIKLVFTNWKSFFKANKDYNVHPNKYKSRPKMPKYKDKTKGRNILIFTKNSCRLRKQGFILFPNKLDIKPIKTKVNNFQQVTITQQNNCYCINIIYTKQEVEYNENLNRNNILGVDLGVNNLITMIDNNLASQPIIIKGKTVKSYNQFYNKKKAELQSKLNGKTQTSKRIKQLGFKRNMKISDYFHKVSRFVINHCLKHQIGIIVIGYNKGWKQDVNLGKATNQKFVMIPHAKLIDMIKYKAYLEGILVVTNEESYTSKCDSLALESLEKHEEYLGTRTKRGMFKSSTGVNINADVNGAINILRKVIGDEFVEKQILINKSCVLQPVSRAFYI